MNLKLIWHLKKIWEDTSQAYYWKVISSHNIISSLTNNFDVLIGQILSNIDTLMVSESNSRWKLSDESLILKVLAYLIE